MSNKYNFDFGIDIVLYFKNSNTYFIADIVSFLLVFRIKYNHNYEFD